MPEQFITPTRIAHTTVNSVVGFQTTEKDLLVDPSRLGRNKNMQQLPNPKIPSTFSSSSSSSAIHPDHYPFDRIVTVNRHQQQQQHSPDLVPLQSTCNSQSPGLGQQQQHQPRQQQQQDDDNDDDSPLGTTADELKMSPTRVADFPGSIAHSSPSPSSSSSSPSSSPSSSSAGNGGGFGPNRSLRSKLAVVLSSPSLRRHHHHHHHRGHDVSPATGGSSSPSKPNAAAVAVMVSSSSSTLVSSSALSSSSSSSSSSFPNATLTASSLSSNSGSSTSSIYRHLAHPDLTSRVRVGGGSRNGGSSSGGGAGSGIIMTRNNGNGIHTRRRRRRRRRHPLQANAHLHHPCRRQAPFQSALPTLDETSSSDEESNDESSSSPSSSYDDDEDDAGNNQNTNPNQQSAPTCAALRDTVEGHEPSSPIPQCAEEATDRTPHSLSPVSQGGDASSLTSLLDEATKTKSGGDQGSKLQRLIRLCSEAAVCAATGEEDAAVATYKKALQWAAGEIVHIQVQLRCCKQGKHPTSAVASIQDRLLQDWLLIGDELVEIQTALAVLYERTGNYKLAISAMQEVLDIYSSQKTECRKNFHGKYGNSLRSTRKTTMKTPEQQNRHDKIADGIRRAQDRIARMKKASASYEDRKKQHAEIILVRKRIATIQHPVTRVKLFQQVEQMVKTVQELEVSTLGWQHAQIADTLTLLSTIATEQGDFEKALAYAKDAADIDQVVVGMRHPKLGQDYLNLARLYSRKSNLGAADQQAEEQAIEYYHRAVEVFRHSSTCQVVVGSALNDLAIVHIRRQEHEIALKRLQESLDAYKAEAIVGTNNCSSSSSSSTNGMCLDAVQVWRNLGECYTQLREFQLATDAFVSALDFQRDARKEREAAASLSSSASSSSSTSDVDPVKEEDGDIVHVDLIHDESVADTLRRLGKAYMNQQKFAEAKVVFLEAAGIYQVAVEQSKNRGDGLSSGASGNGDVVAVALDELAQTLYGVAEAHLAEEDYMTAIRIFDESMHLRLESDVVRAKHNGGNYRPLNNVHCAMCHVGIGNANLRLLKAREAHRSFQEALRHCVAHGIPAGHSIHLMITNRMKETEEEIQQLAAQGNVDELEWLAEVEIRRTSLDRAIEILSRVMSIRRANLKRLKSDKMDTTQEKFATACTLERFGRVLETKGELVEADRALKDASKLFHKVGKPARAQEVEAIIKRLHAS